MKPRMRRSLLGFDPTAVNQAIDKRMQAHAEEVAVLQSALQAELAEQEQLQERIRWTEERLNRQQTLISQLEMSRRQAETASPLMYELIQRQIREMDAAAERERQALIQQLNRLNERITVVRKQMGQWLDQAGNLVSAIEGETAAVPPEKKEDAAVAHVGRVLPFRAAREADANLRERTAASPSLPPFRAGETRAAVPPDTGSGTVSETGLQKEAETALTEVGEPAPTGAATIAPAPAPAAVTPPSEPASSPEVTPPAPEPASSPEVTPPAPAAALPAAGPPASMPPDFLRPAGRETPAPSPFRPGIAAGASSLFRASAPAPGPVPAPGSGLFRPAGAPAERPPGETAPAMPPQGASPPAAAPAPPDLPSPTIAPAVPPQVDTGATASAGAESGQMSSGLQARIDARMLRFMQGKVVGQDLTGATGNLIAARGTAITPEIIEQAQRDGVLPELILHMTWPEETSS